MGRRRRNRRSLVGRARDLQVSGRGADRPRPPGYPYSLLDESWAEFGMIMVLFETPSGFALFHFNGRRLRKPDAMENLWALFIDPNRTRRALWRKEFRSFEDKARAINLDTGVNDQLTKMIDMWRMPGQKIAVGKPEYKEIIEARLGIPCLFDETVMELMWGLKHLMHTLVPEETIELSMDERLQMSQGMKMLLNRYGFDVKPEMVNDHIIQVAYRLSSCDQFDKEISIFLLVTRSEILEVSGIDTKDWDPLTLMTAVKIICYPDENLNYGNVHEMLSMDELHKLLDDQKAQKYEGRFNRDNVLEVYDKTVKVHKLWTAAKELLKPLVQLTKEDYKEQDAEKPEETLCPRSQSCHS